ncbi:MAG: heavy metal translocating P-type ATPase [Phycisphaerae bacterium]|nr:heavy metal translocating P-type ATPase [Phycisphaerae bacterium]
MNDLSEVPHTSSRRKPGRVSLRFGRHQFAAAASGSLLLAGFIFVRGGSFDVGQALYLLAMAVAAGDVVVDTGRQLIRGVLDVDLLMLLAAIGAVLLGGFGEAAMLLFLFGLGHALEDLAMQRASGAIQALGSFAPEIARRIDPEGNEASVKVGELVIGDRVRVLATERLPVDGVVIEGESSIDQSPITGESVPVPASAGTSVFAGSLNLDAVLEIQTTRASEENLVSRMVRLVEEAEHRQAPSQRTAERFTRIYVPVVIVGVVMFILVPPLLGWLDWAESIERGLTVLVGASPCALAISTPAAVLAGIGRTARGGVLVKGGEAIEALGSIRSLAFDKTGTLTRGRPALRQTVTAGGRTEEEVLRIASALSSESTHPLSAAIVDAAEGAGPIPEAEGVDFVPGCGMRGRLEGRAVLVGGRRLLDLEGVAVDEELATAADSISDQGSTIVWVAEAGRTIGILGLVDLERRSAGPVLERLRSMGLGPLVMLSGDRPGPARSIGERIGVDRIEADLLPEQKLEAIVAQARDHGSVAMVGDGVNDAPAFAAATVGIAMGGSGTDVALEVADVALMGDDLTRLPFAITVARRTREIIRQNVLGSMGMVILLVGLGTTGLIGLPLAVVMHEGSTIVVVLNALRLLRSDDEILEVPA